ncbi:MAG TPA: transcriptional regulator [Dehalococcoidia bacterium]|nr:transcriptional regulator [Dehalococcoidia bacterium]
MTSQQQHFIDDMGQQMVAWTLPRTSGRVYGYLLLQGGPVSADQIAADLEVAKSGVSVAVRQLVAFGLARSVAQHGSRRLLHEAIYDLDTMLAARDAQMANLIARLRHGAEVAPAGPPRRRLAEMATLVEDLMDAIREVAEQRSARRRVS